MSGARGSIARSGHAVTSGGAGFASSAGSAGSGGDSSCAEPLAQASTQLDAARACDLALDASSAPAKVQTTCGCERWKRW